MKQLLTIIGCGNMGEAFARFLAPSYAIRLCDHDASRCRYLAKEIGGTSFKSASEAVEGADIVRQEEPLLQACKRWKKVPLEPEL
jgi:pyrroline-5-carboxylate reductase